MHEVWVRMQEDGFVPSDHLKGIMAAPFVAKEKPIPFHVPLEGTLNAFFTIKMLLKFHYSKIVEYLLHRTTKD